ARGPALEDSRSRPTTPAARASPAGAQTRDRTRQPGARAPRQSEGSVNGIFRSREARGPGCHPPAAHHHENVVITRHSFRAMGTDVELLLDGAPAGFFATVEAEFERLESLFSRFRPDSEL